MVRLRDALMAIILCGFLVGPSALVIAQRFGLDDSLPAWITTEDAKYLSGGIAKADVRSVSNLDGFMSGKLQTALENAVGNNIPAKSVALMTNASLQRDAIATSNALFGWDCVPTYYGSSLVSVRSDGRLAEIPQVASSEVMSNIEDVAAAYECFSADHAKVRTFLYFAPDSQNVEGAPAAALMSNPLTYQAIRNKFDRDDASYVWVDGGVGYGEFKEKWYKTDHHWMIEGAYDAYRRISNSLGLSNVASGDKAATVYQEPKFYGSLTRRSLDEEYADQIHDIQEEFPNFRITIDGKESSLESLVHQEKYAEGAVDENRFSNRYAEYFHNDFGLIQIDNPTPVENKSILIVGDSYTNCIERFFACNFATTYVLDPRHNAQTIDAFLAEHPDVEDVVFIMRSTNFLSERTKEALG